MNNIRNILPKSIFLILIVLLLCFVSYLYDSPYDILISDVTSNSVTITWKTRRNLLSTLRLDETNILEKSDGRVHRVEFNNLKGSTPYSFTISNGIYNWKRNVVGNTNVISSYVLRDFEFKTVKQRETISLPILEEVYSNPNSIVYVALYTRDRLIGIKSTNINEYGIGLIDKEDIGNSVEDIGYLDNSKLQFGLVSGVYAGENERGEIVEQIYLLHSGINFIGLDFATDTQASELFDLYPELLLIADYRNNEWKNILMRSDDLIVGQDFFFEQGRGYIVMVSKDIDIVISGWENREFNGIELESGWNLINNEYQSDEMYASYLLLLLNENISTISVWSKDSSRFLGYISKDEEIFGDDFLIDYQQGVFLRVE